jgi:dienelactone hydrolase
MSLHTAALLCSLLLQATESRDFTPALPAPRGASAVGTSVHLLVDPSRTYAFEPVRARHREIVVQLWYPCERGAGEPGAYLPDLALLETLQKAHYVDLSEEVLGSWADLLTHSRVRAPLSKTPERLPVLLFSPGFGMTRASYTSLCEELASHGYLVVAMDHPYAGTSLLPDGRVLSIADDPRGPEAAGTRVDELAHDASFVLDRLEDTAGEFASLAARVDRERIGILGHSLGGAAALAAARLDPRFRACADLDGHPFGSAGEKGLARASLVLLNEPEKSKRPPPEMGRERHEVWESLAKKQPFPLYLVTLENTDHFTFSDVPFVVPPALRQASGAVLEPGRGLEILSRILRAYFGRELALPGAEELATVAHDHGEVTLEVLGG